MAAMWLWRGLEDELELLTPKARATSHPLTGKEGSGGWSSVRQGDALVVWTDKEVPQKHRLVGVWIINSCSFAVSRMPSERREDAWRRAGLCGGGALPSPRLYRVSIVHLEPVRIERVDAHSVPRVGNLTGTAAKNGALLASTESAPVWSGEYGGGQSPADAALKRVARTAAAALYTLGLDIGEAEVELGGNGRTAVRAIWPRLSDRGLAAAELRRFAAWHAAACGELQGRELLIGADPEFVFVTPDGRIAAASRFLNGGAGAAAGSDAMLVGRRLVYPVAELRPRPAADPAELAANLRRLLLGAATRAGGRQLRWAAGAMPVPGLALGGHIHLSGAPLTSRLLRLLDSYVAFPLALVEDPAGRKRRPRYGTLGDYRQQPHGGFEYRTLPSWLVSPLAAKAAFALALVCAREAHVLDDIPSLEERYVAAYYAGDRQELAGCLDRAVSALSAAASYAELSGHIEPLFEAARRGDTWDERSDIRHKWQIPIEL